MGQISTHWAAKVKSNRRLCNIKSADKIFQIFYRKQKHEAVSKVFLNTFSRNDAKAQRLIFNNFLLRRSVIYLPL
jgi:hypothetical protein